MDDQEISNIKILEDKITKLQQNKKTSLQKHKDLNDIHYREIIEKDKEIPRLRVHNKKLLAQVKKAKVAKNELKMYQDKKRKIYAQGMLFKGY